ncbi:hypothetical protein ANN_27608 [Periplaneta americana]|uniref:Per a allergen n=1 Tax=Periplaneta americana TaxID=6978 RepID=A0ABQ8RW75_PERAM|nr:hypothetical protein ANN_27608 [Periplaneta americana]
MQSEADSNGFVIPVKNVQERVHEVTKVSIPTIKSIEKEIDSVEAEASVSYETPRRNKADLVELLVWMFLIFV